jgi:hypothetical protein
MQAGLHGGQRGSNGVSGYGRGGVIGVRAECRFLFGEWSEPADIVPGICYSGEGVVGCFPLSGCGL